MQRISQHKDDERLSRIDFGEQGAVQGAAIDTLDSTYGYSVCRWDAYM